MDALNQSLIAWCVEFIEGKNSPPADFLLPPTANRRGVTDISPSNVKPFSATQSQNYR